MGRRRRGRQRMRWLRWLDGITDLMDVNLSELQELVMDREAWRAVIHGVTKSRIEAFLAVSEELTKGSSDQAKDKTGKLTIIWKIRGHHN